MAQSPPPRRRDRRSRPDADFYASDDPYGGSSRYQQPREDAGPQRRKSERAPRRGTSPSFGSDNGYGRQGGGSRRDAPPGGLNSGRSGRPRSPPPSYSPEPPQQRSRRDPRSSRPDEDAYAPPKDKTRDRDRDYDRDRTRNRDRDPYGRDPYDRDPYGRDPYDRKPAPRDRPSRGHRDDAEPRSSRRERAYSPPDPKPRSRNAPGPAFEDRGGPDPRAHRSRPSSPSKSKPRGRDFGASGAGSGDYEGSDRRHRPRSQGEPVARGMSPGRGRPPPTKTDRPAPMARRNSMPAGPKGNKAAWWKNPLIQAGARTALAAGAQAAMKNRNDPSPWLGAKGAKVATAALGAAFADGFMGQKNSGGKKKT